jgi:hypothetical protein
MLKAMKPKIILCLALVVFNLSSHARVARSWSDAELMEASDLVVVGQPIKVKDLDEANSLGWPQSITFRGVETTFKVSDVLKGMPANDQIVLHHYRFEKTNPPNGPILMGFIPGDTNEYLLYLINDGTNRYAPASGQMDPRLPIKPPRTNFFGFQLLPPIADANPSIRHSISVRVPTRLKVERTADTLSVTINTNSFESANLTVGTNMVTGVQSKIYVYPEGEPRPANGGFGLGGTDFNLGTIFRHTKQDGIPLPGKKYVVELDLILFETDIPPQHMWSPQGSKSYKVLWRRTLKQTVE